MLGARLLLAITMVFTFPMECFVARHALFSAIHKYRYYKSPDHGQNDYASDYVVMDSGDVTIPHPDPNHEPPQVLPHVLVTLGLWGSAVFISIIFGDLRVVLALTGALAASMLGYILPSLTYIKTFHTEWDTMLNALNPNSHEYKPVLIDRIRATEQFVMPMCLFAFGIAAMFVGVGTVLFDIGTA